MGRYSTSSIVAATGEVFDVRTVKGDVGYENPTPPTYSDLRGQILHWKKNGFPNAFACLNPKRWKSPNDPNGYGYPCNGTLSPSLPADKPPKPPKPPKPTPAPKRGHVATNKYASCVDANGKKLTGAQLIACKATIDNGQGTGILTPAQLTTVETNQGNVLGTLQQEVQTLFSQSAPNPQTVPTTKPDANSAGPSGSFDPTTLLLLVLGGFLIWKFFR